MIRGRRRLNRGLLLSRLYRFSTLLYALLALGLVAVAGLVLLVVRLLAGGPG